jgi:hypothetical protein
VNSSRRFWFTPILPGFGLSLLCFACEPGESQRSAMQEDLEPSAAVERGVAVDTVPRPLPVEPPVSATPQDARAAAMLEDLEASGEGGPKEAVAAPRPEEPRPPARRRQD